MKIGVSSYSFQRLINDGSLKQLDLPAKAKDMGFEVIEFAGLAVPQGDTVQAFAQALKEECGRVGIEIGNYTIWGDFINGSEGDFFAEVQRLKEEVKIAKVLGVKSMRHDASWGFPSGHEGAKGFEDALPVLVKGCREVTEFAHRLGIRTMVENHGYFCQDSERIERLVNAVNHENFGVLLDMGNFLCVDEDPAKAVGKLAPYAFHVHAKDFHVKPGTGSNPGEGWFQSRAGNYLRGAIIGHGEVPVVQCLRILKNNKYDGTISVEFEGLEENLAAIKMGFDNLKKYLVEA